MSLTYRHKYIPSMTMTIIDITAKGYKCMVTDPKGKGKVRQGKIEYFYRVDVKGEKALFIPEAAPSLDASRNVP